MKVGDLVITTYGAQDRVSGGKEPGKVQGYLGISLGAVQIEGAIEHRSTRRTARRRAGKTSWWIWWLDDQTTGPEYEDRLKVISENK